MMGPATQAVIFLALNIQNHFDKATLKV